MSYLCYAFISLAQFFSTFSDSWVTSETYLFSVGHLMIESYQYLNVINKLETSS